MQTTINSLETLDLRKQILLARSTLYRLQIQHEYRSVRGRLTLKNAGVAALQALPVRSTVMGIALQAIPHNRLARILALAARILLVAKVACLATALLQRNSTPAPAIRPGTARAVTDL